MLTVTSSFSMFRCRSYGLPIEVSTEYKTFAFGGKGGNDYVLILTFFNDNRTEILSEAYIYCDSNDLGPHVCTLKENRYIFILNGEVVFFDASQCKQTATYCLDVDCQAPLISGDDVVLLGEIEVICTSFTGEKRWKVDLPDILTSHRIDYSFRTLDLFADDGSSFKISIDSGQPL